jgi:hypothetical protein
MHGGLVHQQDQQAEASRQRGSGKDDAATAAPPRISAVAVRGWPGEQVTKPAAGY